MYGKYGSGNLDGGRRERIWGFAFGRATHTGVVPGGAHSASPGRVEGAARPYAFSPAGENR